MGGFHFQSRCFYSRTFDKEEAKTFPFGRGLKVKMMPDAYRKHNPTMNQSLFIKKVCQNLLQKISENTFVAKCFKGVPIGMESHSQKITLHNCWGLSTTKCICIPFWCLNTNSGVLRSMYTIIT